MARFTVDQRQTGFRGDLIAVNGELEILGEFVVLMALLQAVFITDIVGVEVADQEGFIALDGGNWPTDTQCRATSKPMREKIGKRRESTRSLLICISSRLKMRVIGSR